MSRERRLLLELRDHALDHRAVELFDELVRRHDRQELGAAYAGYGYMVSGASTNSVTGAAVFKQ